MKKTILISIAILLVLILSIVLLTNRPNQPNTDNSGSDNSIVYSQENIIINVIAQSQNQGIYMVEFNKGQSLLSIMQKLKETDNSFNYLTEDASFGSFIKSINNIEANSSNEFWNIKINGSDSTVGISDIYPNNNDSISFNLTSF